MYFNTRIIKINGIQVRKNETQFNIKLNWRLDLRIFFKQEGRK